ncbi:uncharacterized protein HMPREF1541_10213 [Cyphellophora europaea CBS 101466]|uniref:Heterokaryon incompatibility domain-containing protein n=1 Tax=Cyphellophora europaea (strain CBS 101466) TaxID=1220924 RepID=W2S940_CYPE1|nr:uncharacterized protein HMPREF1541_10213 [Cyphellophora europaea CBS 101466]ETN44543.1 hypothetical protein HMPREF1541_10213 [Cyphellophora europaea CBS 101466]
MAKLVEPGHRVARYCALSHCWGPPDKKPYATTRRNIRNILSGIPVMKLPSTFQDATALSSSTTG